MVECMLDPDVVQTTEDPTIPRTGMFTFLVTNLIYFNLGYRKCLRDIQCGDTIMTPIRNTQCVTLLLSMILLPCMFCDQV